MDPFSPASGGAAYTVTSAEIDFGYFLYVNFSGVISSIAGINLEAFAAGGANPDSVSQTGPSQLLFSSHVELFAGDFLTTSAPTGIVFSPAGDVTPGTYDMTDH